MPFEVFTLYIVANLKSFLLLPTSSLKTFSNFLALNFLFNLLTEDLPVFRGEISFELIIVDVAELVLNFTISSFSA